MYSNISSCVTNSGYISNYFTLTRGIWQGCPISALLFIFVAEILAVNIRSGTLIKGINVNNVYRVADDTTLFLSNLQSLKQAIIMFNHFREISGLRLNIDKTELVSLGDLHLDLSQITSDLSGMKITNGPFRTLRIWFTRDDNACTQLNFNEWIRNIKQVQCTGYLEIKITFMEG